MKKLSLLFLFYSFLGILPGVLATESSGEGVFWTCKIIDSKDLKSTLPEVREAFYNFIRTDVTEKDIAEVINLTNNEVFLPYTNTKTKKFFARELNENNEKPLSVLAEELDENLNLDKKLVLTSKELEKFCRDIIISKKKPQSFKKLNHKIREYFGKEDAITTIIYIKENGKVKNQNANAFLESLSKGDLSSPVQSGTDKGTTDIESWWETRNFKIGALIFVIIGVVGGIATYVVNKNVEKRGGREKKILVQQKD